MRQLLLMLGLLSAACSPDPKDKVPDDSEPGPDTADDTGEFPDSEGYLGATADQYAILGSILARYNALRATMEPDEARGAVAAEIAAGWEGVVSGGLSSDGMTLGVAFKGGGWGVVGTDEVRPEAERAPRPRLRSATGARSYPPAPPPEDPWVCDPDWTCPQSHGVRIFDAHTATDPVNSPYTWALHDQLIALGFTDVEVVQRMEAGELLNPDGLLDLAGEGLLFYAGHGCVVDGFDGAPSGTYLQLTSSGKYDGIVEPARLERYRSALGTDILGAVFNVHDEAGEITGTTTELLLKTTAFSELGSIEPGTLAFVESCNQSSGAEALLSAGFASTVTWEGKTNSKDGNKTFLAVVERMMAGASEAEAFAALTEAQLGSVSGGLARLNTAGKDVYLPAWGELLVQPSEVPEGTDHFDLFIPGPRGGWTFEDLQSDDVVFFDALGPLPVQVVLRAVRADGTVIETSTHPLDLHPGGGNEATLSEGGAIGLLLSADPNVVAADGASAATISAMVRAFGPDDLTEPTGGALECVQVTFDTDFGTFVGPDEALTGADGTAAVALVSAVPGTATIHALLATERVESILPTTVVFGGYLAARTGVIYPTGNPWVTTWVQGISDSVFVIDESYAEVCYGTWRGEIVSTPSTCADCASAWTFSFQGFLEWGGDCSPFGWIAGEPQGNRSYGVAPSTTFEGDLYVDAFMVYDSDRRAWVPFGSYDTEEREYEGETYTVFTYMSDWGDLAW